MQKVYFLSGTMCTIDLWQFVFPNLENINPVYIDITAAASFKEINTIILNSIEAPAFIVGFSLGGFSAMNFAIHFPEKVKKLVIIAANAKGLNDKEITLRKGTISFLEEHIYKGISRRRINQFLHFDNHKNNKLISIIIKMDSDLGKDVLIRQLKATSSRLDISKELSKLENSILFVSAENDALVKVKEVEELASSVKNGNYKNIRGSGHMIPLEKPVKLVDLLHNFFN